jgi:hypothetical protein
VKNHRVLKRLGSAMAELVWRSAAVATRYGRRKTGPAVEETAPIYSDKWSIQNEVHP